MPLAGFDDDEAAGLHPDGLTDMRVGRSREHHLFSRRQLDRDDFEGMVGPAEYLFAQIAGFGVAPHRLFGGPREAVPPAFSTQHQACKGEVESSRQPHQNHCGGADLRAFDLADRRLRDARALREIGQRPAAAVALQAQTPGNPGTHVVYYSIHSSIIIENTGDRQAQKRATWTLHFRELLPKTMVLRPLSG